MKVLSIKDTVTLRMLYDEISLIYAALAVPNKASAAPDFEKNVGASQSQIDELRKRVYSLVRNRVDYPRYHELCLRVDTYEETQKFALEVSLSRNDIVLLAKAFHEASNFTREFDDFHTMTGHDWTDAIKLQQQLNDVVGRLRPPSS